MQNNLQEKQFQMWSRSLDKLNLHSPEKKWVCSRPTSFIQLMSFRMNVGVRCSNTHVTNLYCTLAPRHIASVLTVLWLIHCLYRSWLNQCGLKWDVGFGMLYCVYPLLRIWDDTKKNVFLYLITKQNQFYDKMASNKTFNNSKLRHSER